MLKVLLPLISAPLAGSAAFASLDAMAAVSLVATRFQFASTEFTVTLKAAPAVCAEGVPVFPLGVPAALLSPGTRICNLANAPALTVIAGLVLTGLLPSLLSTAVISQVPAVKFVNPNTLLPATNGVIAGCRSLGSVDV